MKLKSLLTKTVMMYMGTRYRPDGKCYGAVIESAFGKVEEVETGKMESIVPLVEFKFTGFQVAEVDEQTLSALESQGQGRFAVAGSGFLLVSKELIEGEIEERFSPEEYLDAAVFIGMLFKEAYEFYVPMVFAWPEEVIDYGESAVAIPMSIATPCTEEEWRNFHELHSKEVMAMNMSGIKSGVGFESSEGKTLQ